MTPEKWDGKSREMLVWDNNSKNPWRKIIIGYFPGNLTGWMPADCSCSWQHCAEIPELRKKFRRMTNRELSDLMATGKVEKCYPYNVNGRDYTKVYRTHSYYRNREDSPCAKSILIRYEGTNEWVKPLIEE